MTAKEYLKGYAATKDQADAIEERITQLRELRERVQAVRHNGMPKARKQIDLSDAEVSIDELIEMYISRITSYIGQEADILERIDRISEADEKTVLMFRYVNNKDKSGKKLTWDEIADKIPCTKRTAQYIHDRALKNFPMDDL